MIYKYLVVVTCFVVSAWNVKVDSSVILTGQRTGEGSIHEGHKHHLGVSKESVSKQNSVASPAVQSSAQKASESPQVISKTSQDEEGVSITSSEQENVSKTLTERQNAPEIPSDLPNIPDSLPEKHNVSESLTEHLNVNETSTEQLSESNSSISEPYPVESSNQEGNSHRTVTKEPITDEEITVTESPQTDEREDLSLVKTKTNSNNQNSPHNDVRVNDSNIIPETSELLDSLHMHLISPANSSVPDLHAHISPTKHRHSGHCPKCQQANKKLYAKGLETMRIESIKSLILDRLQMDTPPHLSGAAPMLPHPVLEDVMESDEHHRRYIEDNIYARSSQIIVIADDVTQRCRQKRFTGCFFFKIQHKLHSSELESAGLYFYKKWDRNDPYKQTFMFVELESANHSKLRTRRVVKRVETAVKRGWVWVNIQRSVVRWLDKPHKNEGLAITCKTCPGQGRDYQNLYGSEPGLMPFLVIKYRKRRQRRRARSTYDCFAGMTECCRAHLFINFADIGWDWILYPDGVLANYCTGSCHDKMSSQFNHTMALQEVRWGTRNQTIRNSLEPCCSPVSWSSQSIVYYDGINTIEQMVIPNMKVEACGCS